MATRRELELQITADSKNAQAGVDAVSGSVDELGRAAQETGKQATGAAEQVGKISQQAPQIDEAAGATSRWSKATETLKSQWSSLSTRLQKLSIGSLIAGGIAVGIAALSRLGPAFLAANDDLDTLRTGLQTLGRDQEQVNDRIRDLRRVAEDAGHGLKFIGDLYLDFTGKASAANIPLAEQDRLFDALISSSANLGLSQGKVASSVDILNRMLTSQTVSMTQLERLSRRIPGAMDGVAQALDLTTDELRALADAGQLAAEDVIPALAQSLEGMTGSNDSTAASWQRLKNAITQALQAMGDNGGVTVLSASIKVLAELLRLVVVPVTALVTGLTSFGQTAVATATIIAALMDTTTSWAEKKQIMADIVADLSDKLDGNIQRLKEVDAAFARAAGFTDDAADAARRAAQANEDLGVSAAKLASEYLQAAEALGAHEDLLLKQLEARKASGAAAIAEAKALGDEAAMRKAVAEAAKNEAAALEQLSAWRQTQLDMLRAELKAKTDAYQKEGQISAQRQKEINALQEAIEKKQLEADATRAQAAAAQANAQAKSEEVQAATAAVEAARASAIARDTEAKTAVSLLQTQKELARQAEALAHEMGNEYKARQARIKQIEIDIQITEAKAEAMRAEAEGHIAVAQAQLEEMRVAGELNAVKQAQLEASIRVAEAKIKEAEAIRSSTELMRLAAEGARKYGDAATDAGQRSATATTTISAGWREVSSSINEANAAAGKFADNAELFEKWQAQTKAKSVAPTWTSLYNQAKQWGASEQQARDIAEQFFDSDGKYTGHDIMRGNRPQAMLGGLTTRSPYITLSEALRRVTEDEVRGTGQYQGALASVVRVELPGSASFDVDTTSADGRNQLNGLIRELGQAKLRAA